MWNLTASSDLRWFEPLKKISRNCIGHMEKKISCMKLKPTSPKVKKLLNDTSPEKTKLKNY